jgi:hypothetical protein
MSRLNKSDRVDRICVISTEARVIVVEELRSPAFEAICTTQTQQRALSIWRSTEVANN